jgi:two-component system sensor histidine kinase UhpB
MFATLLILWLAADIARILASVGPRVQADTQSTTRLTQEFVETSLARLQDTPDPQKGAVALANSLQYLRQVRIGVGQGALASALAVPWNLGGESPAWFRKLVSPPLAIAAIPAPTRHGGTLYILIAADPTRAIDESWSQVRAEAATAGVLALAVLLATTAFVRFSLRPLGVAGAALARLEGGDYGARAEAKGSPEFVEICTRINRLAEALSALNVANRQLIDRVLDAHDEERKTIARELHDEIGPHLFALRANATLLAGRIGEGAPEAATRAAAAIRDQVGALQQANRRILAELRPAALEELGLPAAIEALAEQWRRSEPEVTLVVSASPRIAELGPRASLTVYRFVQEALTNAFRHSRARRIVATFAYEAPTSEPALADPALSGLRIRVSDDGRGFGPETADGMGLSGMRERVRALGGVLALRASPQGGAEAEARFGLEA